MIAVAEGSPCAGSAPDQRMAKPSSGSALTDGAVPVAATAISPPILCPPRSNSWALIVPRLCQTTTNPLSIAVTFDADWAPFVVVFTRNSPPSGFPAASSHWPLIEVELVSPPSPLESVQVTTRVPSSSAATLGADCAPESVVFTTRSAPIGAPAASNVCQRIDRPDGSGKPSWHQTMANWPPGSATATDASCVWFVALLIASSPPTLVPSDWKIWARMSLPPLAGELLHVTRKPPPCSGVTEAASWIPLVQVLTRNGAPISAPAASWSCA